MTTSSKRERGRVIALSALTLCCIGFLGSMTYLQSRAAEPAVMGIRKAPDPKLVLETEARKKEKILDLRDKWQVWAKAHQPELRAMLAAQPDDIFTLTNVTNAIPSMPKKENCGISREDLSGMDNYSDPVVTQVSWYHIGADVIPGDKNTAEHLEEAKQRTRDYEHASFRLLRDVLITSATSAWSDKNYCLYASGRVLECKHEIPGMKQKYVEIAPSYDFLVSSKQKPGS